MTDPNIEWDAPDPDKVEKDNPIRKRGDKKTTAAKKPAPAPPASQAKKLCEPLPDLYRMIGMGVATVDEQCGLEIASRADSLGESWLQLAETSPGFRRFLNRLNQANGWGGVLAAHLPLAIAIASHHVIHTEEGDTEDTPWEGMTAEPEEASNTVFGYPGA